MHSKVYFYYTPLGPHSTRRTKYVQSHEITAGQISTSIIKNEIYTHIPKLVHEYTRIGRRNVGQPRNR